MKVTPIRTQKLQPGAALPTLFEVLDASLPALEEGSVVAITSKIVSICEGRMVPQEGTDKDELIKRETMYYLPREDNPYHVTLSITRNLLVAGGGIDESNANNYYVLWPSDNQASVNAVREHLAKKYGLQKLGVIITDSTTRPFQWGTTGIGLAHSGFAALKNYIGTPDIFGRPYQFHQNNIMNGLAAAAVLAMGEGNEQTPLAIVEDVPFVDFQPRNPTAEELATLRITIEEDIYAPLLKNVPWRKGDQK